jgi:hypothetical protein
MLHTFPFSYVEALDELSAELWYNLTFTFSYIEALDKLYPELWYNHTFTFSYIRLYHNSAESSSNAST